MENIRRKIKIFWLEHSDPIIFYTLIIGGVFLVVQILDQFAVISKEQKTKNINTVNNQVIQIYEEDVNSTKLVNDFINLCTEGKTEEAYNLLSQDCKNRYFKTIEEFKNKYYNRIFNKKLDIEVKYEKTNNLYKIIFYEDPLESGKVKGENNIVDYYKVIPEVADKKIYINYNKVIE